MKRSANRKKAGEEKKMKKRKDYKKKKKKETVEEEERKRGNELRLVLNTDVEGISALYLSLCTQIFLPISLY